MGWRDIYITNGIMLYTTDIYEKEILLQDGKNEQVMMEWERPYMNALIDNVKPTGMETLVLFLVLN